jgi:hypothetical protein
MKNALVPLADGFEDIEAVAVIDILRRGGVQVTTAALGDDASPKSAHGISMRTDALLADVIDEPWHAIVLPGGGLGTENLKACEPLLERLRRQKEELEQFRHCEGKARELLARMEVLSRMGRPGHLNDENRLRLKHLGADIRDKRSCKNPQERDIVTNYHVRQILTIRQDMLETIHNLYKEKETAVF